jgi:hypothetical protein
MHLIMISPEPIINKKYRIMKRSFLLLSGFIMLFLLTGCTSLQRYRSATFAAKDNSLVSMDLFGYQLTPSGSSPEGKDLWELSASAQTRLIQILDARYPDNTQFIQALNKEYLTEGSVPSRSYTGKDLRMVYTISKKRDYTVLKGGDLSGNFSPADRIEYLKFSLTIPEEYNLHFTGWNRFATEYGEIGIGDISFTRSMDLEAGGIAGETDLGGTGSLKRTEEQEIRSRYLKLNGCISENKIEIEEEGTREIDLTGNVVVDVSLEFIPFPERITVPLFPVSQGKGGDTSGVAALKFMDVLVPRMEEVPDTVLAILELEYVYRHVRAGWKTFQEWDDHVEYYTGSILKKIPLFYREDYLPSFYCIGTDREEKKSVKVRSAPGKTYPLQFRSYSEASRFLDWLTAYAASGSDRQEVIAVGPDTLIYGGSSLTREQAAHEYRLKIMPVFGD